MSPQRKPNPAATGPLMFTKPRAATDPDALGPDLAALMAKAHATADGRLVALGLDLAPLSGYCYALIEPGKAFDPKLDFTALGQLDLKGGDWDNGPTAFVRLRAFLQVLKPAVVLHREMAGPKVAATDRAGVVAITAGRKADAAIRGALEETLTDWAARCSVPCRPFAVGALKRRFLGRGVASRGDLVSACNEVYGVALDPEGCDVTGVDRVAVAALGLLAGLEDFGAGIGKAGVEASIITPRSPHR